MVVGLSASASTVVYEYKLHFFVPENQCKNRGAIYTKGYVE